MTQVSPDVLRKARWRKADVSLLQKRASGTKQDWKKKSLSSLRARLREALLKAQVYACAYCRRIVLGGLGRNEIDHIIPIGRTGFPKFCYERINLVAVCPRCNRYKGDHNVLAPHVGAPSVYPIRPSDYVWVHPYIHKYSEHIRIHDGLLFEAIGSTKKKRRAMAMIQRCRLDTLAVVEKRAVSQVIQRATSVRGLLFSAVSEGASLTDQQVATVLLKDASLRHLSLEELVELVECNRAFDYGRYEKLLRHHGF